MQGMNVTNMMDNEAGQNEQDWDQCLSQLAKSRDKQLYQALYSYFAPRLNSWLLAKTRDAAEAEELVQEVMTMVWRKASQYDRSKAAASTWLFRIARNLYIDRLRRQRVRRRALTASEEPTVQIADGQLDSGKLQQAIRALPQQQAQVIYKSYFEGKTHSEIAADLEIPLGTVKSSLRLAFQKLSQTLRQPHEH
jgi:RNA polymerase sigma-70 factor (ECF subfamily)